MSTSQKLKPIHVDGFRFEAWNEEDATKKNAVLAASTAENISVPSNSKVVLIQADQDIYYHLTATATVPSTDSDDDTYLPAGERRAITIQSCTNISVISDYAAKVTALFWE